MQGGGSTTHTVRALDNVSGPLVEPIGGRILLVADETGIQGSPPCLAERACTSHCPLEHCPFDTVVAVLVSTLAAHVGGMWLRQRGARTRARQKWCCLQCWRVWRGTPKHRRRPPAPMRTLPPRSGASLPVQSIQVYRPRSRCRHRSLALDAPAESHAAPA